MVSIETLREHFGDLGVEPEDEVIEKCKNNVSAGRKFFPIFFCVYKIDRPGTLLGIPY